MADDEIKKFIDLNRDEFDEFEAPENLWNDIEEKLPKKKMEKMVPLSTVLRIAAGVAILLTVAIYSILENDISQVPVTASNTQVTSGDMVFTHYPELAEAAFYYQSKIDDAETE